MTCEKKARLIAFYLPQYHPIPENDQWWGPGFTEWTNVAQARPLFRGHYQPHVPADLGFYDLRVPEVRAAQAEMAQEYGIEGFCYWHYWFAGKQLLEKPFEAVLQLREPNFPFCLGWDNGSWTGVWVGHPEIVIVEQTYPGLEDHKAHFDYLLRAFVDERYILVDGKPLFYVHRPKNIPDIRKVMDYWRELARQAGLKGLHLVGNNLTQEEVKLLGFDAFCQQYVPKLKRLTRSNRLGQAYRKLLNRPTVLPYGQAVSNLVKNNNPAEEYYPMLLPNWDNTPRFGWKGLVLHNSTPELFRIHARQVIQQVESKVPEQRFVFVKSWNEWAEGNYLEPDQRYGRAFLKVLWEEMRCPDHAQ